MGKTNQRSGSYQLRKATKSYKKAKSPRYSSVQLNQRSKHTFKHYKKAITPLNPTRATPAPIEAPTHFDFETPVAHGSQAITIRPCWVHLDRKVSLALFTLTLINCVAVAGGTLLAPTEMGKHLVPTVDADLTESNLALHEMGPVLSTDDFKTTSTKGVKTTSTDHSSGEDAPVKSSEPAQLQQKATEEKPFDCKEKTIGVSPGRICKLSGGISSTEHMLKVLPPDEPDKHDLAIKTMARSEQLRDAGIATPRISVVITADNKRLNLSTEIDRSFTPEAKLHRAASRISRSQKRDYGEVRRGVVAAHIGESGIAKLAVAGTMVCDVLGNPDNWGFNDSGLLIIDVDISPGEISEYYEQATRMPTEIGMDLSIANLYEMITIYRRMLYSNHQVILLPDLSLTPNAYESLLSNYISSCHSVASALSADGLDIDTPSSRVNEALQNQMKELRVESLVSSPAPAPRFGYISLGR